MTGTSVYMSLAGSRGQTVEHVHVNLVQSHGR